MKVRGPLLLLALLVASVGTVYAVAVLNAQPPHPDLDVYLRGARDLSQGRPLYDPFLQQASDPALRTAFIYPPLFAMVMLPLLVLPVVVVPAVWLITIHVALGLAFFAIVRRLRPNPTAMLVALLVTLAFYPLWVEASQAQANLPLLLLSIVGVLGISQGKPRAGLWIGLAAALKLTPALLVVWLVVERRFRAAAWMSVGFLGFSLAAAVLRPMDSLTYARDVVPQLAAGSAYYSNQSISGVLARVFSANRYTTPLVVLSWERVLVVVLVLAAFAVWLWMSRRLPETMVRGFSFLPLVPLVSALSWEHHLVILLPLVWLIVMRLPGRGWPLPETAAVGLAVLALLAIPHLPIGPPYATDFARAAHTRSPLWLAGANRLFVGTVLLVVLSPWLLRAESPAESMTAPKPGPHRVRPPAAAA